MSGPRIVNKCQGRKSRPISAPVLVLPINNGIICSKVMLLNKVLDVYGCDIRRLWLVILKS